MKLLSFFNGAREDWGVVVGDGVASLVARSGCATLAEFLGSEAYARCAQLAEGLRAELPLQGLHFLPVIPRSEKIVCAVRNYMDHHQEVLAAGMQRELSEEPPIFLRVWRSQWAHNAPIVRPRVSEPLDWEGELAVIIGKPGATSPKPTPGTTWPATRSTTTSACASGSSTPSRSPRARTSKAPGLRPLDGHGRRDRAGPRAQAADALNGEVVQSSHTGHMIFSMPS